MRGADKSGGWHPQEWCQRGWVTSMGEWQVEGGGMTFPWGVKSQKGGNFPQGDRSNILTGGGGGVIMSKGLINPEPQSAPILLRALFKGSEVKTWNLLCPADLINNTSTRYPYYRSQQTAQKHEKSQMCFVKFLSTSSPSIWLNDWQITKHSNFQVYVLLCAQSTNVLGKCSRLRN